MDDEIRAALTALAERAPHADPVRHRVAVRAKTLRQRRAVLAVAGAVAVGATVPAAVMRLAGARAPLTPASPGSQPSPSGTVLPGSPVAPSAADPTAAAGNVRIPLRYRPSWLPDNFVETQREASATGPQPGFQLRAWTRDEAWAPSRPFIQVDVRPRDGADVSHLWPELPDMGVPVVSPSAPVPREEVRVGDRPALAWQTPTGWVVEWQDADGTPLAVQTGNFPQSLGTALRVAESVVPDGAAALESALYLSWLPQALTGAPQYIRTECLPGGDWRHTLSLADDRVRIVFVPRYFQSMVASTPNTLPADTLAFPYRGRSGHLWIMKGALRYDYEHSFEVELAGHRGLYAYSRATVVNEIDFRRIIAGVRLGSVPYTGWFGRR